MKPELKHYIIPPLVPIFNKSRLMPIFNKRREKYHQNNFISVESMNYDDKNFKLRFTKFKLYITTKILSRSSFKKSADQC